MDTYNSVVIAGVEEGGGESVRRINGSKIQ